MSSEYQIFNVEIPLIYNRYEAFSNDPESACEFVFKGICQFNVQDIVDEQCISIAKICVSQKDDRTIISMSGILGKNKKEVIRKSNSLIRKICVELTYLFIRSDCNIHVHQPRIEADWQNSVWNNKPFEEREQNNTADNAFVPTIKLCDLKESIFLTFTTYISCEEVRIDYLENDDYSFLATELYYALGTECLQSKFYHLFSVIEYCETHYKEHSGANRLFTDSDKENICEFIRNTLSDGSTKSERLRDSNLLNKMTDTGRAQALLNILHWMGINSFKYKGNTIVIKKALLSEVINQRNRLFHGGRNPKEKQEYEDQLKEHVGWLFYITLQIIRFLRVEAS